MATTSQYITRFPSGGMNQTLVPQLTTPEEWYDLLNLRPADGQLVQTHPITTLLSLQQFSAESASPVRYMALTQNSAGGARWFVLTENTARYIVPVSGGIQSQIFFVVQTTIPNRTDEHGQALLYGMNTTDFSADNDEIQVEITSSTGARWRKNAGSWTTFTIGLDQAIGSNGLRLAFLATTGFTSGDLWVWRRSSAPPYAGTYSRWPIQVAAYNRDLYIAGLDRTILRLRDGMITSVGYTRVYGRFVAVFYNHLVIAQYARGTYSGGAPADSFNQNTSPWRLQWSNLDDPDDFYDADIGIVETEADGYNVPSNDSALDHPDPGITGLEKWGNQLIIFLSDEMYQMNYVGLPRVMQIDSLNLGVGCFYPGTIVKTPQGLFFWSRDNICVFNGTGVRKIGYPVQRKLFGELSLASVWDDKRQATFAFYDRDKAEIAWTYWITLGSGLYQQRQLIYQLDKGRFFFRNIPSAGSGAAGDIRAICRHYDVLNQLCYGTTGAMLTDYGFGGFSGSAADIVKDVAAVSSGSRDYTKPYAETPDIVYDGIHTVKEQSSFFIDATLGNASAVTLYHNARAFLSTAVSYTTISPTWTPAISEGLLTFAKRAGHVFRFKLEFSGSKPYGGVLNAWGDRVLQNRAEK